MTKGAFDELPPNAGGSAKHLTRLSYTPSVPPYVSNEGTEGYANHTETELPQCIQLTQPGDQMIQPPWSSSRRQINMSRDDVGFGCTG